MPDDDVIEGNKILFAIILFVFLVSASFYAGYSFGIKKGRPNLVSMANKVEDIIFNEQYPHSIISDDKTLGYIKSMYITYKGRVGVSRSLLESIVEEICYGGVENSSIFEEIGRWEDEITELEKFN